MLILKASGLQDYARQLELLILPMLGEPPSMSGKWCHWRLPRMDP